MRALKISLLVFILTISISAQWYQQNSGTGNSLFSVCFTNINNGVAVGSDGTILKTTDGGINWIDRSISSSNSLQWITFINPNIGTIVGNTGIILRTTDGGENWVTQQSGTIYNLFCASFSDENYGMAVGIKPLYPDDCVLLKTIDGGQYWAIQMIQHSGLFGISVSDSSNATMVGYLGTIMKTTDGGITWINQPSGTIEYLYRITFIDSLIGFVVGTKGTILKTSDSGLNWISQTTETDKWLYGLSFIDINIGTVVGEGGLILRTTNGGETWVNQASGTTLDLYSVSFSDENNGTIVGEYGIILQTTNGGVTFIEEGLNSDRSNSFLLSQNYPNPFNPVTKIKYSIPQNVSREMGNVSLKIYDVLGREVATLVNEEKLAGEYEVEFNISNLSGGISAKSGYASGVYFYQLKAGSFVETKKMVLLK